MPGYLVDDTRKVTTHRLKEMKAEGKKIAMLTSYDFTTAKIVDEAGVDMILIGDSASNVMAGNMTTLPITLDQMIYHARSVARAVKRALVVCDMPFGTYQIDEKEAVRNAIRIMKETGCDAVKLEGGVEIIEGVKRILDAGIPVVGHLGLTPQSINKFGTYAVRAKEDAEAEKLLSDVKLLAEVGCCAVVLEKFPPHSAKSCRKRRYPHHRYWCWTGRRTSTCSGRYVGQEQWFLAKILASLRRFAHHYDRRYWSVCGRCEDGRLSEC